MKLYSDNKYYKLYEGDMRDMLEVIQPNSISSIITDPPYELNFMNKDWDNAGVSFQRSTWALCYQVLKPGGFLLAFGGSRTYHRIACAIEDAGFEIRDTIMWLYGSGFPKSMNIGLAIDKKNDDDTKNAWDGWGTSLKPAYEPIIVARKPCEGSTTDNVLKYRVGGINIDGCRVGDEEITYYPTNLTEAHGNNFGTGAYMPKDTTKDPISHVGRFPSNVLLTYDETDQDEVIGGMPYTENNTKSHLAKNSNNNVNFNASKIVNIIGYQDSGSAARYFYCAKANGKDRDEGCEDLEDHYLAMSNQSKAELNRGNYEFSGQRRSPMNAFNKIQVIKNFHPTVKPTELMQYLIRLITPKGGVVLDPFNGSGSTGKAVMYENREQSSNYTYIGIEITPEYLPISDARISYVLKKPMTYKLF